MYFLEISGEASINSKALDDNFYALIDQVKVIKFADGGDMVVEIDEDELQIEGSGEIFGSYETKDLFVHLNDYLDNNSYIIINDQRWERQICLRRCVIRNDYLLNDMELPMPFTITYPALC